MATAVSHIRDDLDYAVEAYEKVKAEFATAFETNPAYTIEWRGGPMMLAQARYELALDLLPEIGTHPKETYDALLEARLNEWRERTLRHIGGMVRTESKSTSAMTNIWADAQAQATLELLEKLER